MHVKKKTKVLMLGIIIVIIGVIVGIIPIFIKMDEKKIENTKEDNFILDTSILNSKDEEIENDESVKNDIQEIVEEEKYLMILEIPKISLKKGIYSLNSSLNSIEKNVAIMEESSLPDVKNGNLVLAAHNGTAKISFFNQLHKLYKGDRAYIYYDGIKYTYVVSSIYDVKKDGDVEITRDTSRNTLTLVTCKKDTKDRQLVIILYLLSREEY